MLPQLLRVSVCLLLFMIAMEVCTRLDDLITYGAPFFGLYSHESLYTHDATGKHAKPHAQFRKWKLNALGYRSPELDLSRTHIVCIGASETFGFYESDDKEYPRELERELNRAVGREQFQVVNVARGGESIWTALQRVPEILKDTTPVAAVIYPTPSFYIDPPSRETAVVPEAEPRFELRLSERVWNFSKDVLPDILQQQMREWDISRSLGTRPAMDELPEENVERYKSDVRELALMLRNHGVEPVLVTHASQFAPVLSVSDRRLLTAWRRMYPDLKEEGFLDMERRMNDAVRSLAREERITLVEADHLMPPGPNYFGDYTHFTDAGAHMMAVYIERQLGPLLAAKQSPPVTAAPNSLVASTSR